MLETREKITDVEELNPALAVDRYEDLRNKARFLEVSKKESIL